MGSFWRTKVFLPLIQERIYSALLLLKHTPSTWFFHSLLFLVAMLERKRERETRERKRERTGGFSSILVKDDRPTSECQANCLQYGPETQSTSIHKWQLFPPEKVQRCSKQARANNQVVTETTETGSWAQVMASVLIKVFGTWKELKTIPEKKLIFSNL